MTWETVSVRLRKTSEGKIDSRYPDGNIPGTPLTWAQIPNQSVIEGELLSLNVRSYLSGTDSSTVAITVDGTLPTGWSFSTSTLSYSGTGTGAATIRFIADGTVTSLYLSVEGIAAQPTDTTAPTVPPQITATVSGANITVEWDQAMDPHDGTLPGSQIKRYELYRNDSLLTSITSLGQGVSTASAMTQGDIGSPTAAGSSSQSVYDWSLTSRGQVNTNVDAFRFVRYSLATPHVVTAKVTGITGYTSDFAKAGVMVRASTDAGAAFVTAQVRQNGSIRLEYRAATGGSRITLGSSALANAGRMDDSPAPYVWLQLRPSENNLWTAYYSEDGSTWAQIASVNVSFGTDILHGVFACSSDTNNAVTATFEDVSIAPATKGSYTHAPGASSTYKVRAIDNANNASGFSHTVTAAPATTTQPTIKWNPGHYAFVTGIVPTATRITNLKNFIASMANEPVKGVQVVWYWKSFEGATRGDYSAGFALVDDILSACEAAGKKLILGIRVQVYAGAVSTSPTEALPQYVATNGWYAQHPGSPTAAWGGKLSLAAATWDPPCEEAFMEMMAAYGARYDGNQSLEMIMAGETATATDALTAYGTTVSEYNNAVLRFFRTIKNYWPKTMVRIVNNYAKTQEATELVNRLALERPGYIIGGPDTETFDPDGTPRRVVWGHRLYRGTNSTPTSSVFGTNLIGLVPFVGEVQFSGLTSSSGAAFEIRLPSEHWDTVDTYQKGTHMVWLYSSYTAAPEYQWSTGILPFIRSINGETNLTAFNGWN